MSPVAVRPLCTAEQGAEIITALGEAQRSLQVFDPDVCAFSAELSRRLRASSRRQDSPAIAALAYWIRPANLARLRADWDRTVAIDRAEIVPRGTVFHLPPTNVDTLFVYSWLLSALMGNANVIRIAPDAVEASGRLLAMVADTLSGFPRVAASTALVSYGHDDDLTASLSQAEVRVIWGGDETVRSIRSLPVNPLASEIAFPNRFSLAVIDARSVLALPAADVADLAQRFFNDAYWFDQLGCASPRAVVWRGDEPTVAEAAEVFFDAVEVELDCRHYRVPDGAAMAKLVHLVGRAADGELVSAKWGDGRLSVGWLEGDRPVPRDGPGAGLFYTGRIDELKELIEIVQPVDQTLSYFGFDEDELRVLARSLGARGIDRVVAIGNALNFDRFWDGNDLLRSFTRFVSVE